MKYKNYYTYITTWLEEDECFISKVLEFPSIITFGYTIKESEENLDNVLDLIINWMHEQNEIIPLPLCYRHIKMENNK